LGSSIGQLKNGPFFNGIRKLMLHTTIGHEMQWKKSHPSVLSHAWIGQLMTKALTWQI
jgi:hypothetical protein